MGGWWAPGGANHHPGRGAQKVHSSDQQELARFDAPVALQPGEPKTVHSRFRLEHGIDLMIIGA